MYKQYVNQISQKRNIKRGKNKNASFCSKGENFVVIWESQPRESMQSLSLSVHIIAEVSDGISSRKSLLTLLPELETKQHLSGASTKALIVIIIPFISIPSISDSTKRRLSSSPLRHRSSPVPWSKTASTGSPSTWILSVSAWAWVWVLLAIVAAAEVVVVVY